jgi:hypothetical protein
MLLHPDPYKGIAEWCCARCEWTENRLQSFRNDLPTVLINHFPLREDLATLPRIPRFSLWCGTRRTEDWHLRYNAVVVVSGHLHIRSTSYRDGVRFEGVSLGYPNQWTGSMTLDRYVRESCREADLFAAEQDGLWLFLKPRRRNRSRSAARISERVPDQKALFVMIAGLEIERDPENVAVGEYKLLRSDLSPAYSRNARLV